MEVRDISDLVRHLQGEDDEAPRETLTRAQMRNRLAEVYARYTEEPETFKPGDAIRHKWPSHSSGRFVKFPAIFVRYLPEKIICRDKIVWDDETPYDMALAEELDCEVMFLVDNQGRDGRDGVAVRYVMDSRQYEKDPEAAGHTNA